MRHFWLILNIGGVFRPAVAGLAHGPWLIFPQFGWVVEMDRLLGRLKQGEHILWG